MLQAGRIAAEEFSADPLRIPLPFHHGAIIPAIVQRTW
jgi:hypothetical protein